VSNQIALLRGNNTTRANNDEIYVSMSMEDSAGNETEFARLTALAVDVTNLSEDGRVEIDTMIAGTLTRTHYFEGRTIVIDQVTGDVTLSFPDPAANVTVTFPSTTDTLVARATTDTLTNKTLTTPTIAATGWANATHAHAAANSGGQVGLADTTGTLAVGQGGTGATTLGDAGVLIGNGTGVVQVTGAGTSGQVLTSNGAGVDPTFQAAAAGGTDRSVRATKNAAQSISDSIFTALTFQTEDFDTDTMHSIVTNTSRITLTTAGKYLVTARLSFVGNATGRRIIRLDKNGVVDTAQLEFATNGTNAVGIFFAGLVTAAANDYIEVFVFQSSGGALDVQSDTLFMAAKVLG